MAKKAPSRKPRKQPGTDGAAEPTPRRRQKTSHPGPDGGVRIVGAERPCATAADIEDREVEYLWTQRLLIGEACLVGGVSEVGKSTLLSAIAAAVTTGRALPGGPALARPRSVLWFGSEEDASTVIKPRLRAAGADLGRVFMPEFDLDGRQTRARPRLPRDARQLARLALDVDAAFLVMDPIASYIELDLLVDAGPTARAVCEALQGAAREARMVSAFVKHPKKLVTSQSPLEQISGHKEWTNTPRSVLLAGPHPDRPGSKCLASLKGSVGGHAPTLCYRLEFPGKVPVVCWEEEADLSPEQLFDTSGTPSERDHLADARALLEELAAASGEVRVKALLKAAEDAAISPHFLRKAKKQLGYEHHTVGPNDDRYHVWRRAGGGTPNVHGA